jgi:hypothetical protein
MVILHVHSVLFDFPGSSSHFAECLLSLGLKLRVQPVLVEPLFQPVVVDDESSQIHAGSSLMGLDS